MNANPIRKFFAHPLVAGLLVSGCVFAMCADDAMAQRRGGGGGGMSRGGGGGGGARAGNHGGRTAQSSVSGGNRSGSRSSSAGGSRSGGSRSVERNGGDRTRTSGDRTTNIGSNNNVNIDRGDVNIDVEGGWGGSGCCWGGVRHPIAAGVTIGAIAGWTAAAVGSYYYALPPSGCTVVVQNGVSYHHCGSAYYSEAMNGDEVVYVSVNP
jgi:hypothetical protein